MAIHLVDGNIVGWFHLINNKGNFYQISTCREYAKNRTTHHHPLGQSLLDDRGWCHTRTQEDSVQKVRIEIPLFCLFSISLANCEWGGHKLKWNHCPVGSILIRRMCPLLCPWLRWWTTDFLLVSLFPVPFTFIESIDAGPTEASSTPPCVLVIIARETPATDFPGFSIQPGTMKRSVRRASSFLSQPPCAHQTVDDVVFLRVSPLLLLLVSFDLFGFRIQTLCQFDKIHGKA